MEEREVYFERVSGVSALRSKSQLQQDLFVLSELGCKRDGYFVEFGAADGVTLSNTYLLEKDFGWQGVLAEPAHRWHVDLRHNRGCAIETECVWSRSGMVMPFVEPPDALLSTVSSHRDDDGYASVRHGDEVVAYDVATISLHDLLAKHHLPQVVDYLSIDTEGSEFEILEAHDFGAYAFRVITCEHNFQEPRRSKIRGLLEGHGYQRKYVSYSEFDDWYIL